MNVDIAQTWDVAADTAIRMHKEGGPSDAMWTGTSQGIERSQLHTAEQRKARDRHRGTSDIDSHPPMGGYPTACPFVFGDV